MSRCVWCYESTISELNGERKLRCECGPLGPAHERGILVGSAADEVVDADGPIGIGHWVVHGPVAPVMFTQPPAAIEAQLQLLPQTICCTITGERYTLDILLQDGSALAVRDNVDYLLPPGSWELAPA